MKTNSSSVFRQGKFWQRIQGRLFLLLLTLLIPILLIETYDTYEKYQWRRAEELQANLEIARSVARTFETFIQEVIRSELAIGLALASPNASTDEDRNRILDRLAAGNPTIRSVFWMSPEGVVTASSLRSYIGFDLRDRSFCTRILEGKEWAVSELIIGRSTQQPAFTISRGIRKESGELVGIVAASIEPDMLENILAIKRSEGGAVSLIDNKGMLVYRHPKIHPTWEERNWLKQFPGIFPRGLRGEEVSEVVYAEYQGKNRIIGLSPIASIGWVGGAGRTEDDALANITAAFFQQGGMFLAVALLSFFAALAISRTISNPIKRMRERLVSSGSEVHFDVYGPSEVRELAAAFNSNLDELRKSGERLRIAKEAAGLGIHDYDPVSGSIQWDARAREIWGLDADTPINYEVFISGLHPEDRAKTQAAVDIALDPNGDGNYYAEYRVIHLKDGVERWVAATGHVFFQAGRAVRMVGTVHDITERKRMMEEIESLARFPAENLNPVLRISGDGELLYSNRSSERLLEYCGREPDGKLPQVWREQVLKALESGHKQEIEQACDGEVYSLLFAPIRDFGYVNIYGKDITAPKRMEEEREITIELLKIINQSTGTDDLVEKAVTFFQGQSGCEAVGIRLKKGEDYPYHEARGFPQEFIEMENSLCSRDSAGAVIREPSGNPCLDCMCGNVICGRVDPSKPFFTQGGSFWANDTTRLLATTTDADRQTRTRNRCNGEGYESVALIPLKMGEERLGLLQLNDRRKGMFTPEGITQWERLAGYFSIALARHKADGSLRESERNLAAELETAQRLQEISSILIQADDIDALYEQILDTAVAILHAEFGSLQMFHPERRTDGELRLLGHRGFNKEAARFWEWVTPASESTCGVALRTGARVTVPDVSTCDFMADSEDMKTYLQNGIRAVQSTPLFSRSGKLMGILSTHWREPHEPTTRELRAIDVLARQAADLIDSKQAEESLRESESRFRLLSTTAGSLLSTNNPQEAVNHLCREVMRHLDCHTFFNFLVDDRAGKLHLNACAGIPEEEARRIEWLDYGVAVCGCVAQEGVRIIADDIFNTPDPRTELVKSYGIQAYACHPLIAQDQILGTLSFGTKTRTSFSPEDLALMKTVADQVATAMQRMSLIQGLRESRDELELRVKDRTVELESINLALSTEIEERKRAEGAVRAERQRFLGVLETLPVYVCLLTTDYHVPFVNWVFRERFGEAEAGVRCFEHLFGRSEPCEICETYKVLETGSPQQWEWTGPDERIYSVFDLPFKDIDGSNLILEMGIDITERKHADAQINSMMTKLEQSNQSLQDFASVASHDMKEPLRKVISFGNMLRQKYKDSLGETGNDYLNRMIDASQRMQTLLTSLLELSRVAISQEPFEEIDLYDLVHEVLSDLEVSIARSGAEVQVGKLPSIAADPTQMRQLFQNLIANALKFHKEGEKPVVKVRCETLGKAYCQIVVEDNGIGFEEEHLEKIFAPFHRIHGRSSKYEGTGMGLAICKKIVERHGGSITAKSSPDHGSSFIIMLPSK